MLTSASIKQMQIQGFFFFMIMLFMLLFNNAIIVLLKGSISNFKKEEVNHQNSYKKNV